MLGINGLPLTLQGWEDQSRRGWAGCAVLGMRAAGGAAMGCKEPAWSPRHFSDPGAGLGGLAQSWTRIGRSPWSSRIPLAAPARLPAGSALQEVAARRELSVPRAYQPAFRASCKERRRGQVTGRRRSRLSSLSLGPRRG